ncbi:F5/8 type C domain-containing protein [Mucilaginibacter pineti]|uniref:F5/8 type C domain-containing protein n=1 Tax=Mucilaginibacter pineti TaxID=1391627 RepID=A0A1G6ZQ37_9SPHI|nr:DUF4998 domain-containing protein [Mucilaginibacter pineti]SDE04894.1 F5/8 type C domain-containing protein [Mucilaginibacter pineti]
MKKILHIGLILLVTIGLYSACTKMDATYKQYVVPGGLTYTGKATSPKAYSGLNRIKIAWLRGADPSVVKAKIFWNNFADSLAVDIPPAGDTISAMIENLDEKNYTFVIRTYDGKGNSSIPVEVVGGSYGVKYQAQLLTRPVNSTIINAKGVLTINWGGADVSNGAFASEVKYTDVAGNVKYKTFSVDLKTSEITDLKPGTNYQFRTIFKPDSLSIDNFYTSYSGGGLFAFDKKDWKIIAFSSQHPGSDNTVTNFIDGTDATRWHSCAGCSSYPHFATIDMGVERTITQFGVWRTTFETGGDSRAPDKIQFFTSTDNVNWADQGIFNFNRLINGEQRYLIPNNPKARYFKFVGVSGPENNMVMGEISAYGL